VCGAQTDALGENVAGEKMKSTSGWKENGNGTNESGFSGFPGGNRNYLGKFNYFGGSGYWWSSTKYNTINAWNSNLFYDFGSLYWNYNYKENGFSVRCLRD
jgi:uncharacterized protein (TIGR02145 family)